MVIKEKKIFFAENNLSWLGDVIHIQFLIFLNFSPVILCVHIVELYEKRFSPRNCSPDDFFNTRIFYVRKVGHHVHIVACLFFKGSIL